MHGHAHGAPTRARLRTAAAVTGLFVVLELAVGWWANSLALVSDAGHNFTTCLHMDELVRDVEAVQGVRNVHDLHVWSLGSNVHALSAHLVVDDPESASNGAVVGVVRAVKQLLAEEYGIAHATLETHCSDSPETDCLVCEIKPLRGNHNQAGHHH